MRILIGVAMLAALATPANAQGQGRSPVMLTIAEGQWGPDGPPIVILPDAGGGTTIVLRSGATPEDLFAALSIVEARRTRAKVSAPSTNPIVVAHSQPADRLPHRVRNRLAGHLRSLQSARVREVGEFGALKAIDVRFLLRDPLGR